MSEELSEMFADMKEVARQERRDRAERRQAELDDIRRRGYVVQVFNGGVHTKIRWLSFWPSTGRWINEQTRDRGSLPDLALLLPLVEKQVGKL